MAGGRVTACMEATHLSQVGRQQRRQQQRCVGLKPRIERLASSPSARRRTALDIVTSVCIRLTTLPSVPPHPTRTVLLIIARKHVLTYRIASSMTRPRPLSTSSVVLLAIVLVLAISLLPQARAFGAGNIPSYAYMEGKAFRESSRSRCEVYAC